MKNKNKFPTIMIEVEVRDKNGKLTEKRRFEGHSWVANIISLMRSLCKGGATGTSSVVSYLITNVEIVDTGNTLRGMCLGCGVVQTFLGGEAPAGYQDFGIRIGLSDAETTYGMYNLQSPISEGTGVNQINYGATTVEVAFRAPTSYFRVIRIFTNNSAETITVNEMAFILKLPLYSTPMVFYTMLARDVILGGIDVPVSSTLTLRYIVSHVT